MPPLPVRPPGSVPEREFLQLCIRCGECFKACPNNVLQPLGFEQGLEGLWTPAVKADWAGCESSCNACDAGLPHRRDPGVAAGGEEGRPDGLGDRQPQNLPAHLPAKRRASFASMSASTPATTRSSSLRVGTEVDAEGQPIEGSGFLAPVVLADKCVGCGLCQTRCYGINVAEKHLLESIRHHHRSRPGKEDRLLSGSYLALREQESAAHQREQEEKSKAGGEYLPDFLK